MTSILDNHTYVLYSMKIAIRIVLRWDYKIPIPKIISNSFDHTVAVRSMKLNVKLVICLVDPLMLNRSGWKLVHIVRYSYHESRLTFSLISSAQVDQTDIWPISCLTPYFWSPLYISNAIQVIDEVNKKEKNQSVSMLVHSHLF